jgi:hypothetical protein
MARSAAAPLLLLLGVGCNSYACPLACNGDTPATFVLSCSPSDLTSVTASGPCALADANPEPAGTFLSIYSPSAGLCHVTLTFATGFTQSADVTFVSRTDPEPPGCATCSPYIAPTQRTFMVSNPPTTCIEAGTEAGGDATIGD